MSLYTDCGTGVLVTIPAEICPESFGQATKAFVTKRLNGTALNQIDITVANEHTLLATWQALKAATDATKIAITPRMAGATMPEPEIRTFGSGNETELGIPINLGENFSSFNARFLGKRQDIIKEMKKLTGDLAVYLVDHLGRIMGVVDDQDAPTYLRPIPILNFAVTSKQLGGYDAPDANAVGWSFLPNWSDDTKIFKPAFNPLTDL